MTFIEKTTARLEAIEHVKRMMKEENKMKTFKINSKGFIIPNGIGKTMEYIMQTEKSLRKIFDLNDLEFTPDSLMFQLWQHNKEELKSDNLVDHGFTIVEGDHKYRIGGLRSLVPYELFKNAKEDDIVNFKMHGEIIGTDEDCILDISCQCIQSTTRYRNFGEFHQAMQDMMMSRNHNK